MKGQAHCGFTSRARDRWGRLHEESTKSYACSARASSFSPAWTKTHHGFDNLVALNEAVNVVFLAHPVWVRLTSPSLSA